MSTHQIIFQVWRPNGTGRYRLAGFDEIIAPNTIVPLPPADVRPMNSDLAYYRIMGAMEDPDEDHNNNEDNKPLYFQPGDILGFYTSSLVGQIQMYPTYRNWTESDSPDLAMDMIFVRTNGDKTADCEINTCSNVMEKVPSVVPNIFFTYGMLS